MNTIRETCGVVWDFVKGIAKAFVLDMARAAADWLMDRLSALVVRVEAWLRGHQPSVAEGAGLVTSKAIDAIVGGLATVQAELIGRREALSVEDALNVFQRGLATVTTGI